MAEIKFEIVEHIADISEKKNWKLELNRVKWNDGPAKLDLRSWSEDHSKCSKGISLTDEEADVLKEVLLTII